MTVSGTLKNWSFFRRLSSCSERAPAMNLTCSTYWSLSSDMCLNSRMTNDTHFVSVDFYSIVIHDLLFQNLSSVMTSLDDLPSCDLFCSTGMRGWFTSCDRAVTRGKPMIIHCRFPGNSTSSSFQIVLRHFLSVKTSEYPFRGVVEMDEWVTIIGVGPPYTLRWCFFFLSTPECFFPFYQTWGVSFELYLVPGSQTWLSWISPSHMCVTHGRGPKVNGEFIVRRVAFLHCPQLFVQVTLIRLLSFRHPVQEFLGKLCVILFWSFS